MNNYETRKNEKIEALEDIMSSLLQNIKLVKAQLEVMKNDDTFKHIDVSILASDLRACCEVQAENIMEKIQN